MTWSKQSSLLRLDMITLSQFVMLFGTFLTTPHCHA
jgi:hypothetical protein